MKTASYILFLLTLSSCVENQSSQETTSSENEPVNQIEPPIEDEASVLNYEFEDITMSFTGLIDPHELGLYEDLKITVRDSLAFQLNSENLELEGVKFGNNEKSTFQEEERTLYVIEANNRPEPNFFILIGDYGDSISFIGKTETLTGEIFDDIDNDGFLEIGGFNIHCQAASKEDFQNPDFCMEHFRVFEITTSVRRDSLTEEKEKNNIRSRN